MKSAAFAAALSAVAAMGAAPQQPAANQEIFLASLRADATPAPPGEVTNISSSPGYDNQPSFLPDATGLLFASDRAGQQTDIFRYDFASRAITQITKTPEREYSPTVTPDRQTFSVVRVEADAAQRLWRFDLDGSNPRLVLERIKPVGYHAWIDATHLALFVLGGAGQPATLQLADTASGDAVVIESGIGGRAPLVRPGRNTVTFVSKPAGSHWVVKELDPRTKQVTTITETVDQNRSEDCAWTPGGALLMSSGSKIFAWTSAGGAWTELADFSSAGLTRLTRLAVAPAASGGQTRLALVAEPAR
jgi:hypothetical protein